MRKLLLPGLVLVATALPVTFLATNRDRPVLDVIVAYLNGDLDGFLDRMKRVQGVVERL